jgi:hypothetical protein
MNKNTPKAPAAKKSSCQSTPDCESVLSEEFVTATKQLAKLIDFFCAYTNQRMFDNNRYIGDAELKIFSGFKNLKDGIGMIANVEFKERVFCDERD